MAECSGLGDADGMLLGGDTAGGGGGCGSSASGWPSGSAVFSSFYFPFPFLAFLPAVGCA